MLQRCALLLIAATVLPALSTAAPPREQPSVATLPAEVGAHWVWVPDRLLEHSLLYDGDTGEVLGMIDSASTLTPKAPVLARARGEFYSADVAYSRGLRGERSDFVSIYDTRTLRFKDEILLPNRMGESNASLFYAEMLGDRFLAVYNQFPNVSISIVDLEGRRYVQDVPISGCAGIYPLSAQRLATLCGNGTALLIELDEAGRHTRYAPSPTFFDVVRDPVAMAAGRAGQRWTFVSFAGKVHTVDFSGESPSAAEAWPLATDSERRAGWRPGGLQHVAVHGPSGRLFVVMHQGEPGSHKAAGPEIWVYDLKSRERLHKILPPNLTAAFLAGFMQVPTDGLGYAVMSWLLPSEGVHSIAVSQDEQPLLFARSAELGVVAVIDAESGQTLRMLTEAGLAGPTLRVP